MIASSVAAHTVMLSVFLACMHWSANLTTMGIFGAFALAHAFCLLWAVNRGFSR